MEMELRKRRTNDKNDTESQLKMLKKNDFKAGTDQQFEQSAGDATRPSKFNEDFYVFPSTSKYRGKTWKPSTYTNYYYDIIPEEPNKKKQKKSKKKAVLDDFGTFHTMSFLSDPFEEQLHDSRDNTSEPMSRNLALTEKQMHEKYEEVTKMLRRCQQVSTMNMNWGVSPEAYSTLQPSDLDNDASTALKVVAEIVSNPFEISEAVGLEVNDENTNTESFRLVLDEEDLNVQIDVLKEKEKSSVTAPEPVIMSPEVGETSGYKKNTSVCHPGFRKKIATLKAARRRKKFTETPSTSRNDDELAADFPTRCVQCPMCFKMFSAMKINDHAFRCRGDKSKDACSTCCICFRNIPQRFYQLHVRECFDEETKLAIKFEKSSKIEKTRSQSESEDASKVFSVWDIKIPLKKLQIKLYDIKYLCSSGDAKPKPV